MKLHRMILMMGMALALAACGNGIATRDAPFDKSSVAAIEDAPLASGLATVLSPEQKPGHSLVTVRSVKVLVPETLEVSEANRYFPKADIVWRGEPIGDRHKQVHDIVETAMKRGVDGLDGDLTVDLEVEVLKFHALTEKARYTTGGVHNMELLVSVRDINTGELLLPARKLKADLEAFGGNEALQADAAGQTQKVRITAHLAAVINAELTRPEGYQNAQLGLLQWMHNL